MNYWEQLKYTQISSIQRRIERFRIYYTWKSLSNMVPSLGFEKWNHPKYGIMIRIPKVNYKIHSVRTKRDRSIYGQGPILFNSLPRVLREYEGGFNGFKALIDIFLGEIPDRPCLNGYRNGNNDIFGNENNTIPTWI